MQKYVIEVDKLCKSYQVPEREPGLKASMRSLFKRTYQEVQAVKSISFGIQPGEMVGFIGPNGAGKTTTLKMLSGLLEPTRGSVQVLGFEPWKRHSNFLKRISMVLGNKSQMIWDIPPLDTFQVLGEIYGLSSRQIKHRVDEMVNLLDMEALLSRPVRNLSLGERMKCELVAGLLHKPDILFLDEPTLGLDVSMQLRLRKFLLEYNHQHGITVILTSHYMADVMALCPRVMLIHHGELLVDGDLNSLAQRLAPFKLLRITLRDESEFAGEISFSDVVQIVSREANHLTLRVERESVPRITAQLLETYQIADLTVEDAPIETVIDQLYQEKVI
ncbi:MAG: ATP-binding cassette domain-containing protein [Anaerolineaceae bacterium]|nr:ATP-binding cassette domain-containing protein [Anaerolineaceae bacterium]